MAVAVEQLDSAGLEETDLATLDDATLVELAVWHKQMAGDSGGGRPWWPAAIRTMPFESRVRLAIDPRANAAWEARERLTIERDPIYFTRAYGHVQPEEGPPIPFDLWPEQEEVLEAFVEELRTIVLKARQLGLTWLALHYGVWILCFDPRHPNARILALSKQGGDAGKLLGRARDIMRLLPAFIRPYEDPISRRSGSKLNVIGRGEMISLPGTASAARAETAALAILDEFAFIRNRMASQVWTAVQPTLGSRGKAIVISTGNGPAEVRGDGQALARLWGRARSDDPDLNMKPIFLPTSTHPDRDDAWHRRARADFLTEEEFLAEYPETEEEALAGRAGLKVFGPAGINAAERLGREYDELLAKGEMPPPVDEVIYAAADWGENTAILAIWELEGGGIYIPPCEVMPPGGPQSETGRTTRRFHELMREGVQKRVDGYWEPAIGRIRYDAAGVQSVRTFASTVEGDDVLLSQWEAVQRPSGLRIRTLSVPFNKYKEEGKDYLRYLFDRTRLVYDEEDPAPKTGVIAISPKNRILLRQLRSLELRDDGSGKIAKGDDHGPDAMIAGVAPLARRFRQRTGQVADDVDPEEHDRLRELR